MPITPRQDKRRAAQPPQGSSANEQAAPEKHSYREILKSSALIAASSTLTTAIGIIRTKALALLLGPAGFGLMGIYGSIADLTRSIAEMGINSSGVRQIAEAVGSGDIQRIARTVAVLRRVAVVLAIIGTVLLFTFSGVASALSFGNDDHTAAIAILSLAVLFQLIADAQAALLQGMRRITDLARIKVLGALFGTIFTIPIVFFFRGDGVVPSLIVIAAMSLVCSWWYSRKVKIQLPILSTPDVRRETASLLKLGSAFMASSLFVMGSAYAVRVIILRSIGLDAAGFYQAAWTLGGLYVSMILQAMGADFYPRLTGAAGDNVRVNRLVNEQAHVSLLLAGPGVIATITFAPLLMVLFYSKEFDQAAQVLRWISLGMALRVVSWPIGIIIIAKGVQSLFFLTELAWTIVLISVSWVCVKTFGLDGAGIAFFGSYVFHALLIYFVVQRLTGFQWAPQTRRTALLSFCGITPVFVALYFFPGPRAITLGIFVFILSSVYSLRSVIHLVSMDGIHPALRKCLTLFGITTT